MPQSAADLLLAVRQGGPRLAGLGAAAPRTEAEVWAIQQEVLRRTGGRIGGYKCAAPPGKPASAAIMAASGLRPSGSTWTVAPGETIGIETEIAFRLGRGLPPRATPYTQAEVLDCVEAAFPVIEMVVSRYQDPKAVTPEEQMADNVAHAGLIIGAEVPGWREMELAALTVRQSCGGEVQVEKLGGNPSGHPFVPLVWLANHLPAFGLQLEAGQVVTTGSCTGLLWVGSHQRVTGEFLGFGAAVVELA
ncbi:2-keto-4-pentenoate hydratase [Paeniroseomonas aquatica]|uniref:2-keto-4-pentenoate hydratase n=1 Tax=Paeniroseomonas aquatica TaxID=373043 RepID=A0ABT8ABW6_9PROT|nr:fumarylacetoacetate hydrolase family protein [Paeniroseomonas aquatica]MDN3567145.1 2-keto-4-pentenoate hydratase [Paeniroseomonas aquatica]